MYGNFGIFLALEFNEGIHGLGGRAFHDDVNAAPQLGAKDACMTAQQLMNFVPGHGIWKLCYYSATVYSSRMANAKVEGLTLQIFTTP